MKIERLGTSLIACALVAAGIWGCDADSTESTTASTTASTGGAGGAGGVGGAGPVGEAGFVARSCMDDSACGPAGRCILATDFDAVLNGGPAGGYCTLPCQVPEDCPDPGSDCRINPSGEGECLLGCTFGEPEYSFSDPKLDPHKCHGREDVACTLPSNGLQVCTPSCGSDSQCPVGRTCHPLLTVCVDTPPEGKPYGDECDDDLQDCAGYCLSIPGTEKETLCTSLCVLGGDFEESLACGGIGHGWCIAREKGSGAGLGDQGYCLPSCQTQEDCRAPDFFCVALVPASTGVCFPATECMTAGDCPLPATSCTDTTLGKFCLSSEYPLGALDPMSGP